MPCETTSPQDRKSSTNNDSNIIPKTKVSACFPSFILSIAYTVCSVRSQCDMAVGTKLFFDMMHDAPPKIMLFGDACSHVTAPIAESSVWWNIWQVWMHLKPTTTVTTNYTFGVSLANVGERNYSCLMTEVRC